MGTSRRMKAPSGTPGALPVGFWGILVGIFPRRVSGWKRKETGVKRVRLCRCFQSFPGAEVPFSLLFFYIWNLGWEGDFDPSWVGIPCFPSPLYFLYITHGYSHIHNPTHPVAFLIPIFPFIFLLFFFPRIPPIPTTTSKCILGKFIFFNNVYNGKKKPKQTKINQGEQTKE